MIYNIDESKIPAKGAVTRCKKCQSEISIKPPAKNSLNTVRLISKEMSIDEKLQKTKATKKKSTKKKTTGKKKTTKKKTTGKKKTTKKKTTKKKK